MGPKSSKQSSNSAVPLSRATIEELCRDTGFTERELLDWHTNFYNDCPDGRLTLKQFEQEYSKIMGKPTAKTADYIKHMFNVYDQDKNQFIDFREFVMALSAASAVNRLRLIETLFHVFDLDNDGKITKEEIGKMLHTLVDVTDSNNKHNPTNNSNQPERGKAINLQQRIDDAFNELNANDDDYITKDEFIEWYMKSGLLSDVQSDEINDPEPSRFHKLGKKSRKQMRHLVFTKSHHEQEENRDRDAHPVRHMSKMIERRTSANQNNENYTDSNLSIPSEMHFNDSSDDYSEQKLHKRSSNAVASATDYGSSSPKENERWQHLFNSVLGQIRVQRLKEQQTNVNNSENITSWKHEGIEKTRVEYMKQKSNGAQNPTYESTANIGLEPPRTTAHERSPSPDIVTIRL